MKSDTRKVLHGIAGRPMIGYVLDALAALPAGRVIVVVGPGMDDVVEAVAPAEPVLQHAPRGTGHAALSAREALSGFTGDVLVLFGADPLITPETLRAMIAARATAPEPAIVVLGMRPADPALYGRLIVADDGGLENIVEARDATAEEQAVTLCNAGAMAVDGARLFDLLERVGNDNAKGEYYLTDIVAIAREDGLRCAVVEGAAGELIGIDSPAGLAAAEALMQGRLRGKAMAGGVTLLDPSTVTLAYDTAFGRDVVVEPHVVFGPGVRVGNGVRIRAFSHLEGATLADGAVVGPFARLRPGAEVGVDARIGNFVEVKNAAIEAGAKVMHLTYIGDARVGANANVGAGTITCNYDGFTKSHTDIGAGAFIGSNTALVAPVKVGDGAIVGAGSVITRDVPADALATTRAPQESREGGAKRMRDRKRARAENQKKAKA